MKNGEEAGYVLHIEKIYNMEKEFSMSVVDLQKKI